MAGLLHHGSSTVPSFDNPRLCFVTHHLQASPPPPPTRKPFPLPSHKLSLHTHPSFFIHRAHPSSVLPSSGRSPFLNSVVVVAVAKHQWRGNDQTFLASDRSTTTTASMSFFFFWDGTVAAAAATAASVAVVVWITLRLMRQALKLKLWRCFFGPVNLWDVFSTWPLFLLSFFLFRESVHGTAGVRERKKKKKPGV